MPDDNATPDQQDNTTDQQVANQTATTQTVDWEARYKGSVAKIEQLTLANRSLNDQLMQKSSEMEQLRTELTVKDTEKQAAVGERDKRLNDLVAQNAELKTQLEQLKALKLKVDTAKKLGRPDMLAILDTIPSVSDPEALENIMKDLGGWVDQRVQAREQQLMAGVTATVGAAGLSKTDPGSEREWQARIDSFALGTAERAKALDQYGDWLEAKHTNK